MLNRLLAFAILLAAVLACADSPNRSKPSAQSSPGTLGANPATSTEAIVVTAPKLFAAYDANEVAADEIYKGKTLRVSGTIDAVGKDILDAMYVTLSSGRQYSITNVQCMFSDDHKNALAGLKKGQSVTLLGTCNGKFGNVLLKDCRIE